MCYTDFSSNTVNIEIDFYQQSINKSFHFALFVKKRVDLYFNCAQFFISLQP